MLVPRTGDWGARVGAILASRGALPLLAPLIAYERPEDPARLTEALARLASGDFDWLMVTSATTVDALVAEGAQVPSATKIAAVGLATARALHARGFEVAYTQQGEASAAGLVEGWQVAVGGTGSVRALVLRSDLAPTTVSDGLAAFGHQVHTAVAYSTVSPELDPALVEDLRSGRVHAALITSGSVARALASWAAPLPAALVLASIGPRTTAEAAEAGLTVHVTSPARDVESLILALEDYAGSQASDKGEVLAP